MQAAEVDRSIPEPDPSGSVGEPGSDTMPRLGVEAERIVLRSQDRELVHGQAVSLQLAAKEGLSVDRGNSTEVGRFSRVDGGLLDLGSGPCC